jgi:hypothetical protein
MANASKTTSRNVRGTRGGLLQRDPTLFHGRDTGPAAAPAAAGPAAAPPAGPAGVPAPAARSGAAVPAPRAGGDGDGGPRVVTSLRVAERELPAIPAHSLPHRPPLELLLMARRGLLEAMETRADGQRYATAHLAALRAAAAVLAARARPTPQRRGRPTSVWVLLTLVAPEMSEWAAYFAASAAKRSAAEAGIPRTVTAAEADDLLSDTRRFIEVVEISLDLPHQPPLMTRAG